MTSETTRTKADYGFDAPTVPIIFGLVALAAVVLTIAQAATGAGVAWAWLAIAVAFGLQAASFVYTTRLGKKVCWQEILSSLDLRGDETFVDLGCGRGMVLISAAKRIPHGHGTGVDIWQTKDQSGNAEATTQANLVAEGVADRVTLATTSITELPYPDGTFELALSALVIHNITDPALRAKAVTEAMRVLKPGGRLVLADFQKTGEYRKTLVGLGAADVAVRGLGWRYWYGGPWTATRLVTARKTA